MIKFGQIIEENAVSGMVTVRFERPEACGKCGACGSQSQKGEIILPSSNHVGEWVRVELPENRFLQATALVYIVPLLGLLVGLLMGWLLSASSDLLTMLGAACGLAVSFLALFIIDKHISKKSEWMPKITGVYPDKPTHEDLGCELS